MVYAFKIPESKRVIIEFSEHANDEKPILVNEITDKKVINKIREMVAGMPETGDMFVSFSPIVDYVKVIFFAENGEEYYFSIYGGRIQILDTTFLARDFKLEEDLVKYIESLR